jgi:glycerol-3-phosphate acyltransferase PlsY
MAYPAGFAVAFLIGYVLGAIPFGLFLTSAQGIDIRKVGSGNIGATNVLRTGRRGLAAATLLLDGGKGAAAVLLVAYFASPLHAPFAGFGAVVGHCFPVWLRFRGGKGVATALGVFLAAMWPIGAAACAIWLAAAKLVRISSASALIAIAAVPILAQLALSTGALGDGPWRLLRDMALAITLIVFIRHRDNIRRLLAGTEPRIGSGA